MNAAPLCFCGHHGSGIISRLIKWQTRGVYSHVSILLPDCRQVEAWWDGVQVRDRFDPHGGDVDFFTVGAVTPAQVDTIVSRALAEKGAAYDFMAIADFITRGKPTSGSQTRWFCSELAYACAAAAGLNLLSVPAGESWRVDPVHFFWSPQLTQIPNPLTP
jgi:uncharacterized protein YycO